MSEHIPQWLIAAADQRLAEMTEKGAKHLASLMKADALSLFLTEPPEGATREERALWEFRCDNCGADMSERQDDFWSGAYTPGHNTTGKLTVIIGWGACRTCRFLP